MAKGRPGSSSSTSSSIRDEATRAVAKAAVSVAKDEARAAASKAVQQSRESADQITDRMKKMSRLKKFRFAIGTVVVFLVMMCLIGNAIFLNEIANSATSSGTELTSSPCGSTNSSTQAAVFFMMHIYSFVFGGIAIVAELGYMRIPVFKMIFKEFHVMKSLITRGLVQSFIGISTASLYVPNESGGAVIYNQVFGWALFIWGLVYTLMRCTKTYLEKEEMGDLDSEAEAVVEKYIEMEEGGAGVDEEEEEVLPETKPTRSQTSKPKPKSSKNIKASRSKSSVQ